MAPETLPRSAAAAALAAIFALAAGGGAVVAHAAEIGAGDVRARLSGSLAGWHVFRLDPDTPSELPSGVLDLRLDAKRKRQLRLFAQVRAGFDGKIGEPGGGNPVLGRDEIYQDKDIFMSFEEAYLDILLRGFDVRVGKQKVSWGRLDELQPTDNLNPEDISEFIFRPELERKIGVPGVRVTGYFGDWTGDAVWNPFYTAYRFPNREDRWFPPLLAVPDRLATEFGPLPVRTRYPDVEEPPHTLANSDAALRVGRRIGSAELSASVFHGFDKKATFAARARAMLMPTGNPLAPVAADVDLDVFPTLHRVTVVGGDLAVPLWVLALRAEAAWIHGRFFPLLIRDRVGSDPRLTAAVGDAAARVAASGTAETIALPLGETELSREALQYGLGFDYTVSESLSRRLTGSDRLARTFVMLQLIETVIFDHDSPFIDDAVEHVLGFTVSKGFRDDRLLAEIKVVYNPNHGDFVVWPQLAYKLTPSLHALFEARILGGSATQPIGQYRDHDGIGVGLKQFF